MKDNIYHVRSHMFVTGEGHHMETIYAEDYTGQLFRSGPHARAIQIFAENNWWEPTAILPARTIDLGKFKIEQMRILRLQK